MKQNIRKNKFLRIPLLILVYIIPFGYNYKLQIKSPFAGFFETDRSFKVFFDNFKPPVSLVS